MDFKPDIKVMFSNENSRFFGPGVYELLDLINRTNSIKEASSKMGISYSKARKMIKKLEYELGKEFVNTKPGGYGGGESCITEYAKEFLSLYEIYLSEVEKFCKKKFIEIYKEKDYEN